MKTRQVIVATEHNEDDIDSLLNASLHEQLSLPGANNEYHQKFQSIFNNDMSSNEQIERKDLSTPNTAPMNDESIVSTGPLDLSSNYPTRSIKRRSSLNIVAGAEVELVRRDSTISAYSITDTRPANTTNPSPDSISNHSDPQSAILEGSNSSLSVTEGKCSLDSTSRNGGLKRRTSLPKTTKQRRRSISFNETVDRVTYDLTSYSISQKTELLEGSESPVTPEKSIIVDFTCSFFSRKENSPISTEKKTKTKKKGFQLLRRSNSMR